MKKKDSKYVNIHITMIYLFTLKKNCLTFILLSNKDLIFAFGVEKCMLGAMQPLSKARHILSNDRYPDVTSVLPEWLLTDPINNRSLRFSQKILDDALTSLSSINYGGKKT